MTRRLLAPDRRGPEERLTPDQTSGATPGAAANPVRTEPRLGQTTPAPALEDDTTVLSTFFPPAPPCRRGRTTTMIESALFLAVGTWLVLASRHGGFLHRVWAEDGSWVLTDAFAHPPGLSQLFRPFSGYLNLYPRLAGALCTAFPVRDAAAVLATVSAVTAAGVSLLVWRVSASHLRSTSLRAALALGTLVLPIAAPEMLANSVNVQWWLWWAALWALLWRPSTWGGRLTATSLTLVAALSSPLAVILLPLIALRLVGIRDWRQQLVSVALAAGCFAQVVVHLVEPPSHVLSPPVLASAQAYAVRVGVGAFLGVRGTSRLWGAHPGMALLAAGVAVAVLVGCAAGRRDGRSLKALTFAVLSMTLFAAPLVLRGRIPLAHPGLYLSLITGGRYSFLPQLTLLTGLFFAIDRRGARPRWERGHGGPARRGRLTGGNRPSGDAVRATVQGAVLVVLAAAWLHDGWLDRGPASPVVGERWGAQVAAATVQCRAQRVQNVILPISPEGGDFRVRVPCARLR